MTMSRIVFAAILALGALTTTTQAGPIAIIEVEAGGLFQRYVSETTAPGAIELPGATATWQFAATEGSTGLASFVDGPVLSASLGVNTRRDDIADASIRYSFAVVGPAGDVTLVPLLVSGQYSTVNPDVLPAGAGGTQAVALLRIGGESGGFEFDSYSYNFPPEWQELGREVNSGAGTYQGSFFAAAGSSVNVAMRVIAWRRFDDIAPIPVTAEIDPYVQIDPAWAVTHPGYSLVFDAGVGNSAPGAVPEPTSLALLGIGGLGALALLRRKRSSHA